MISHARALLAVSSLAALAVPMRSLAQAPTFNTVIMTPTGSQPWQPPRPAAVGDFNGDGKLDALIVDSTAALRYMRGNGDGTFARSDIGVSGMTASNVVGLPASLVPYMPNPVDGYMLIKAADVNGDGKLDAICVTTVHINWNPYSLITVLINTGNDANGVPQFSATNYFLGFYDVRSLTVGDLNGDGKPDFIVGSAYASLFVYLNNGGGTFTAGQVTSIMPNAGGPAVGAGVIADVNGDGKADFIVTSGQANATDLFLGNGDGTLQAPTIITPPASSIAVADLNKDGKPDLIEGLGDGSVSVYLGNGNGTFGSPANFPTGATGGASGLFISDVNGDGNLDVAVSLYNAGSVANVAILLGNGAGTFGAPNLYGGIPNAVDVTLADFNGDGKPDIASVSANGYGGQNYALLTNTTPAPLPTQTLTILGGSGNAGDIAANVEYYNPATGNWQPAYLESFAAEGHPGGHPWGNIAGTNSWINYRTDGASDPGSGPNINNTYWYLYRVRFTVPSDAVNPKMTFSIKADNLAQVAINGVMTGGSVVTVNNVATNNVILGQADQLNADAVFSQAVHTGENTITIKLGDFGGIMGLNFRIDLSMQSSQPLQIVPTVQPPVVASNSVTAPYGSAFSYQISATNSPTSYGAGSLPAGLSFNTATGVISGTLPNTVGTSTIGISATNAGGTGTGVLTLNVVDTTPPVITAPSPIVAEATSPAGAVVNFTATANDAISGSVPVTATPASGSTFPLGLSVVTLTATDAAGNQATAVFSVTVKDTTPPALTVPGNQTLEATGPAGAMASFVATATDAVTAAPTIGYSAASGSVFPLGTTTVVVTATDAAGNKSTGSFTITVRDTTPPVLALPASQTLEATSAAGAVATFSATASDIVSGAVAVNFSTPSGSTFPLGTTTVLATATDAAGNTAAGSFTITVRDTTPPVLTLPANQTLEATGPTGAIATFAASATDLVTASPTIAYSLAPGSMFALGTTTVTVTATDAAGNATTGSFTVTVRDTTPPNISALAVTVVKSKDDDDEGDWLNLAVTATVADLVDPAPVTKIATVSYVDTFKSKDDDDHDSDKSKRLASAPWVITGNLTLKVRRELKGGTVSRIYTLTVQSTDFSGNVGTKTVTYTIAKHQDGKKGSDDKKDSDEGKSKSKSKNKSKDD